MLNERGRFKLSALGLLVPTIRSIYTHNKNVSVFVRAIFHVNQT